MYNRQFRRQPDDISISDKIILKNASDTNEEATHRLIEITNDLSIAANIISQANGINNITIANKNEPLNIITETVPEPSISETLRYDTIYNTYGNFSNYQLTDFDDLSPTEITIRQGMLEDNFRSSAVHLVNLSANMAYITLELESDIGGNILSQLINISNKCFTNSKLFIISDILSYIPTNSPLFTSDTVYELIIPFCSDIYNEAVLSLSNLMDLTDINRYVGALQRQMITVIDILRDSAAKIYFPLGGLEPAMVDID